MSIAIGGADLKQTRTASPRQVRLSRQYWTVQQQIILHVVCMLTSVLSAMCTRASVLSKRRDVQGPGSVIMALHCVLTRKGSGKECFRAPVAVIESHQPFQRLRRF